MSCATCGHDEADHMAVRCCPCICHLDARLIADLPYPAPGVVLAQIAEEPPPAPVPMWVHPNKRHKRTA